MKIVKRKVLSSMGEGFCHWHASVWPARKKGLTLTCFQKVTKLGSSLLSGEATVSLEGRQHLAVGDGA
jgi:hypothetical protein